MPWLRNGCDSAIIGGMKSENQLHIGGFFLHHVSLHHWYCTSFIKTVTKSLKIFYSPKGLKCNKENGNRFVSLHFPIGNLKTNLLSFKISKSISVSKAPINSVLLKSAAYSDNGVRHFVCRFIKILMLFERRHNECIRLLLLRPIMISSGFAIVFPWLTQGLLAIAGVFHWQKILKFIC